MRVISIKGESSGGGGGGIERKEEKGVSTFFLRSTEIGPSIFVGARSKVDPRNEGYAWVPKSESFVKFQEVGNFLTRIFSSLKVI